MDNVAHTANRVAGGTLRFLFAPQLFSGLKPSKGLLLGFVQMIAQFLATAQLIPATHRALNPRSVQDARLGEVLALAYSNARQPGTRLDQWTVLMAATALMGMLAIMTIYMISVLLIGTANAAISITLTFNQAGCGYVASTSFFTTGCANDMAQQWVDMLLLGNTTNWFATQIVSLPVAAGLAAMFQTYSYAMLVLAGFLVLYHLLVIIAGTAHEGKFGGRGMNQVWAPIRLVAAIGMLVPIGVNGLNSGQMIVTQVAKWGSALASNVWSNFANTYAVNTGAYILFSPMPQISGFAKQALNILICEAGVRAMGTETTNNFNVVRRGWWETAGNTQRISFDYNAPATPNGEVSEACGYIEIANPNFTAGGESFGYLTTNNTLTANDTLRRDILLAHQNAINNMIDPTGAPLVELADAIWRSADGGNTAYILEEDDVRRFNDAVRQYRIDLSTGIRNSIYGSAALGAMSMANDAMSRGWISAAVWFNQIARTNGMLLNYTQYVPASKPDANIPVMPGLTARLATAFVSAEEAIADLPGMATSGTSTFALAEPDFQMGFSEVGAGSDLFDFYLNAFGNNMIKNVGSTGSNTSDEIATTGNPDPNKFGEFRLNTANPLAELSALGYRLIALVRATNRTLSECQQYAAAQQNALRYMGGLNYETKNADMYQLQQMKTDTPCGEATFGSVSPTGFMIQAVVGTMLMAGITLAFVLPLIPFIRFLFGILTWVLSLFETVIAIPVVALAHIKMDGEGLSGPLARTAYLLMLQLFLRPTLMVFGMIMALLIFNLMVVALNEFYTGGLRTIEQGGSLAALGGVVYSILYGILAYAFANASFKAIDVVPNQALQWIGGANSAASGEAEQVTRSFGSSISNVANSAITAQQRGMIGRV